MPQPRETAWRPPKEFGEYVVERAIARGSMGQVYLARDTMLARQVAIKFIGAAQPSDTARRRLILEARAAAQILHPNVAAVHRVADLQGHLYIVSEFVEGKSLDALEMPIPTSTALHFALGLARGLTAAHAQGILHRDIKPANVIIGPDETPKLVDFGLAKLLEGDDTVPSLPVARRRAPRRISPGLAPTADLESAIKGAPRVIELRRDALAATLIPESMEALPAAVRLAGTLIPDLDFELDPTSRGLTRDGALLGTPDYMAPESWRGDPATKSTDVYALGGLMYEMLSGAPPYADVPGPELPNAVQTVDAPALLRVAPQVDPRLAAVVDRCLRRDPAARYESAKPLLEALEHLAHRDAAVVPEGNPYRGLAPFDAQHRGVFFGREPEIEELEDRLARQAFLLVTGDSGTGKSSLCRAGLLPRIANSGLRDGRQWATMTCSPGRQPFTRIAAAFASMAGQDARTFHDLALSDPKQAALQLQRSLGSDRGVLCFVDQLEELVTQADSEEAKAADALLTQLACGFPGLKVLATVRADFLTRLASLPGLGRDVTRHLFLLSPIGLDRLRQIVTGPAEATGIRFESDALIDRIVGSLDRTQGGLPILQFALARLWEARDVEQRLITESALDAIGGVSGALAQHADQVLSGLLPAQRQDARNILVRLVSGDGVRVTRPVGELTKGLPSRTAVLDQLVQARLLTIHEGAHGHHCTLVHDFLIHGWATLAQWLAEKTESRLLHERLGSAARQWIRLEKDVGVLWSGRLLSEASVLKLDALSPDEAAFLQASRAVRRRARLTRIALAACFIGSLGLVWFDARMRTQHEIDAQVTSALEAGQRAKEAVVAIDAQALEARASMQAKLQSFDPLGGEAAWAQVRLLEGDMHDILRRAGLDLEAKFALDPQRPGLRHKLAELAFFRAALAGRRYERALREELIARAENFDDDGELTARFRAPASLEIPPVPAGTRLELVKYVRDDSTILAVPMPKRQVKVGAVALEAGSYRLSVKAPGYAEANFPFVLQPGEVFKPELELLAETLIPEGFVHVPAGRFIFGSTEDEESRIGFFSAPPAHTATVSGFIIGRYEVTFRQWLEFLDALPEDRRETLIASMVDDKGVTTGEVGLRRGSDRVWSLEMHAGDHVYRARAGTPIRYEQRERRKEQDWLRFPAIALSAKDSEAYAAWLSDTGRVPGARLCTEHEWERAARGADDRPYPHGVRLAPEDVNFDQTYAQKAGAMGPDEVGSHPAGKSPFGVEDMTGNVWEWTTSSLVRGDYVLRGGSFFYDAKTNRSTNRQVAVPSLRVASVGVRLCAPIPQGED